MAKFKKGQSGNPAPKGARDKRTTLREVLAPRAEALLNKAVELAMNGDTTALRLCLERILAPVRAKDEPVILDHAGISFTERGMASMQAGLTGHVTPAETAALMQALVTQTRVFEAEELQQRVAALEERLK